MLEDKVNKEKNIREKVAYIDDKYLLFIFPFFAFTFSEMLFRGNITDFIKWIIENSREGFLGFLSLFGLINIFYVFNKKFFMLFGYLAVIIVSFGGYVSNYKSQQRGEPLIPWDLTLGKEAVDISKKFFISSNKGILILLIGLIVFGFFLAIMVKNQKYNLFQRIGITIIALIISLIVFTNKLIPISDMMKITTITWDQKMHSDKNGFNLGFVLNTRWIKIIEPNEYTKENIDNILMKYNDNKSKESKKPNIIFIQSEAFWDPILFGKKYFDKDPIPYFHSLQKQHTSGTFISPVYGGGTVNTEYEVITGLSTHFLPSGAIAFAQYIREPLHSMPRVLEEIGYKTTGIHTYQSWFYRRNEVYKNLGFDNFIGQEFFLNPEYKGQLISDNELTNRIISEIKSSKDRDFIYGVSMENHGPYPLGKNKVNSIKVNAKITNESKNILETYTQTLTDVDLSLKLLIEKLERINEPTVVVFYGDHLPMLGSDYKVYKEMGYFEKQTEYKGYLKMHSVPILIWSNYLKKQDDIRLSANMLSSYILDLTNLNTDPYFKFLSHMYKEGNKVSVSENFHKNENVNELLWTDYEKLNYDILFGEKYFDKDKKLNNNDDFYFGSGGISLKRAIPSFVVKNKENEILIEGINFSTNTKAYIDNKEINTTVINSKLLKINISKSIEVKDNKKLSIILKVYDSMNNLLSKSNHISLEIIDDEKYTQKLKSSMKKIDLTKLNWEFFSEGSNYVSLRTNLKLEDLPYELSIDNLKFIDTNADSFDKAYLSDIYLNGYLYISIPKTVIKKDLNKSLEQYFIKNHAELRILK